MKYLSFLTGVSILLIFAGCGDSSNGETIYIPPKNNDTNSVNIIPAETNGAPVNTTTINTPVLTTQEPVSAGTAATGLNPEHGKPGHRCDLAVGAPLNSPSQLPNTTTATPAPASTPSISAKNATIVTTSKPAATGMNPEHGKPGHRCDIAVGAPLDSKPAAASPVQTATTKTEAPVTPLLPATSTPVAEGMNPEHGKPGHRCDIAVGAPLPKQ